MSRAAEQVFGILLAAGAGRRFGGDKLLQPLTDGIPVAAHAARNLLAVLPDVVAVVRWGDSRLYEILEQEGCRATMFEGAARGMGASLAHGIGQARDAGGWVVALADMPHVRPETVRAVVKALAGGAALAAPRYSGERGHPVGFSGRFRDELLALNDDNGARGVLARHRDELVLLDCGDPGVVLDVDLPEDLERARGFGGTAS